MKGSSNHVVGGSGDKLLFAKGNIIKKHLAVGREERGGRHKGSGGIHLKLNQLKKLYLWLHLPTCVCVCVCVCEKSNCA